MTKRLRVLAVAAVLIFPLSGTALAGGWALTVVDEVPAELEAGTEYQITYTILQHGRTPAQVTGSSLNFLHPHLKEVISFPGTPTDKPGQYVASVTLPTTGSWGWEVNQGGFGVQELGSIEVLGATNTSGTTIQDDFVRYVLLIATVLAAVTFGGLFRQWRQQTPMAPQSVV